jgi:hypothetical protein
MEAKVTIVHGSNTRNRVDVKRTQSPAMVGSSGKRSSAGSSSTSASAVRFSSWRA